MLEPRKEEIYGYVKVVKEERRDPEALHRGLQRGLGIKHPERILGYAGLFFDTGDVYASCEVAEHMTRYPGFSATILEILKRFSKEDYGEVSDSVVQDNGESRWLSGGRFLYGRYGCGKGHDDPERFHVNIRVRKHWDHTFVTYESEPDWFLFLKDEDLPALEDRSAQIRSKALETLEPRRPPEEPKAETDSPEEGDGCGWRFGIIGTIVEEYTDEYGLIHHGTDTFGPGTRVWLRGKNFDPDSPGIQVLGVNRYGEFELDTVAVGQVSRVHYTKVLHDTVLYHMRGSGWWGNTGREFEKAKEFRSVFNSCRGRTPAFCAVDPTHSEKYSTACADREIPEEILAFQRVYWMELPKSERKAAKDVMALNLIADYPYKLEAELKYTEDLRKKEINERNWLRHLDEMTDSEITYMLEQQPGKDGLDRNRKDHPEIPDRIRAEFLRDF